MDLTKNGELLKLLRKSKNLTQKEIADRLGVVPKTVSKWETGHGFPDVSMLSSLADILGVSERILLSGSLIKNTADTGNMKKTKFYVCPHCGSIMQGVGECQALCCGKILEPVKAQLQNENHMLTITDDGDEFYIEINHPMTKEHYILFVAYVRFDKVLAVRLYPEQDCAVRIAKMHGGKFVYYCNAHGLFEYNPLIKKRA